jgi:formate C-acetyltransferase
MTTSNKPLPALFKVETDHASCIYRCGERAAFSITVTDADGIPLKTGRFHAILDNYGARVLAEADIDLATANPFAISAVRETPGFMRLRIDTDRATFSPRGLAGNGMAGEEIFQWGVAYEPEKIRPAAGRPADFDVFWADAVRKLDETIPSDPQLERLDADCTPGHEIFRISFASYGGRRVWGWLNMPNGKGPFPVRVNVPGAGIGACGATASDDEITLTMNVHSYPQPDTPEERDAAYKAQDERFAAPRGVARYCQAGIHLSREDYFYYASLLGINRAVNWLWAHPAASHADFTYSGTSQGGGFGLMLTGLNGHFTRSCIFVPAICDLLGSLIEERESGWPKIIDAQKPENREAAARNAPYFDGASFAAGITCPIRFVAGFGDCACPPASVYAAYNCIPSTDKAIFNGIGMGHGVFPHFYDELGRWIRTGWSPSTNAESSRAPRKQRGYTDMTWWDPYVEDIADTDTYLRRKFRQDVTDKATGLSQDALHGRLMEIVAAGKAAGESWRVTKAKCFAAQAMEQSIDVSPLDWFPAIAIWDRLTLPIAKVTKDDRAREVNAAILPEWVKKEWHEGNAEGIWNMWQDFDHSVPDWRVILPLGFPGLKARLAEDRERGTGNGEQVLGNGERGTGNGEWSDPFYDGLEIAIDAILGAIDRFVKQGEKRERGTGNGERRLGNGERLKKEIACLERLRNGAPQTAYDVMMFVWLYFFFSEHLDGIQCRSLTELDVFLTPYYDADIAAGRTTEAEFREQVRHFLWQWGSVSNYWNQPVGFGGTNPDGTSAFNHVSKIILDVMDECALTTPKFLVKVAPNTPDWAWNKMLDMARRHRSIAFIGEEPAARALKKWAGASDQDCREMVVRGCYEFALRDGCNSTGVGHVNFLKIVEKMLAEAAGGSRVPPKTFQPFTFSTFQLFLSEYLRRLAETTDRCRKIAFEFEKVLPDVNPANLMTLATEHALRTRRDGFANGCPRGNNTAILSVGLGTAVDALLAVKELVFEKKEFTLAQLGAIMAANWEGHEALRLRMLRSKRKWGNNDPEANALGKELIATFAGEVNGKPNSRGGVFLASGHCARQFIVLGEKTGATPDGRKAGEEMSKNLSPTMGADTEGATALVLTLASADVEHLPGDYPLDMMLHPSVCAGDDGLAVMRTLVKLFHKNGGSVIQFTVFSAEELRDAQAHPEKYENLQVRVCGWNVRWNDLARAEQDAYIRRAENVAQG